MNARRDPDRLIHAFLMEGTTELADEIYDTVRDRIEETRQRAVIGPWRAPDVNRYLKIALAAAAVLVVAVIGFRQFGGANVGGPGPTQTPAPTATPAVTPAPSAAAPSASAATGLAVGSAFVLIKQDGVQGTVTIAAPGWDGDPLGGILIKDDSGADPPDGAGLITFVGPLYVFGEPCQWKGTAPDAPAATVDALVAALTAQASRDATDPVDITVGGYAGKSITLHVPDDAAYGAGEFTDCDQGYFGSWTTQGSAVPERYHQGPGQIDELWILDVDGVLTVIDTAYYAGTPVEDIEEMRAIVKSATFE